MMTLPEYLAEVARRAVAAGYAAPFQVRLVRYGIPWWFWVDATGATVPPPQTVYQPTVTL